MKIKENENRKRDDLNFIERVLKIVDEEQSKQPIEDWSIKKSCERIEKNMKRLSYKNNGISLKTWKCLKEGILDSVETIKRRNKTLSEELFYINELKEV